MNNKKEEIHKLCVNITEFYIGTKIENRMYLKQSTFVFSTPYHPDDLQEQYSYLQVLF